MIIRHNLDQILITKALCDVMASLSQSKSIVLTDCKEQITSVVHNEVILFYEKLLEAFKFFKMARI